MKTLRDYGLVLWAPLTRWVIYAPVCRRVLIGENPFRCQQSYIGFSVTAAVGMFSLHCSRD